MQGQEFVVNNGATALVCLEKSLVGRSWGSNVSKILAGEYFSSLLGAQDYSASVQIGAVSD